MVSGGKAVPIPYNGSVARLRFGPATHRKVKKWLADGDFDVLHLHEPNAPSLSMLALMLAEGPIVATFHTSTTKSLTLSVFQGILRPYHEKIVGRIAVSDLARRWQMEALGSDAVEIPNGVDVASFAGAARLEGYPRAGQARCCSSAASTNHARGWRCCWGRCRAGRNDSPTSRFWSSAAVTRTNCESEAGDLAEHLRFLGQVDDAEKASALRSADVYCAPNTGGESFGIVLVEAMAARTAVVASDLDAFRRVLTDGAAGAWCRSTIQMRWPTALIDLLRDDGRAAGLVEAAAEAVKRYDWSVVAGQIMRVYETVAGVGRQGADRGDGGQERSARETSADRGMAAVLVGVLVSWCWRSSARGPSRPPTGWTGCTSATTCPGRRSTARWRRRAVVARAVAADAYARLRPRAAGWPRWPRPPNGAPRSAREAAENELSRRWRWSTRAPVARAAGGRTGRRRGPGAAGPAVPQRCRPRHPGAARTSGGAAAAVWAARAR